MRVAGSTSRRFTAAVTPVNTSRTRSAFTLVELLLALVLVLALVSAVVFSFSSLLGGTQLEEGAGQLESLLRFARAHAANTGRKVQIVFDQDESSATASVNTRIRVTWESDPLGDPGTFDDLVDVFWQTESLNGLVQVKTVQLLGPVTEDAPDMAANMSESPSNAGRPSAVSPITFYPDGSSDSAEIILGSQMPDDEHQMAVRLEGLSGAIRHQLVVEQTGNQEAESGNELQTPGGKAL